MADATVLITLVVREVMNLRHDQINPIVQAFALGRPTAMTVSLGFRMDDKYETKSVKIAEKKNTGM